MDNEQLHADLEACSDRLAAVIARWTDYAIERVPSSDAEEQEWLAEISGRLTVHFVLLSGLRSARPVVVKLVEEAIAVVNLIGAEVTRHLERNSHA